MLPIARRLIRAFGKDEWFITYTGRRVWVLHPIPEDIDLRDIGHALSQLCRFNGHTREFYSVAQHSVRVYHIVERTFGKHVVAQIRSTVPNVGPKPFPWKVATTKEVRTAAMHDSPEAYLGDVIRPLKMFLPIYRFIEDLWWDAIRQRFDLCERIPPMVKYADQVALLTERRDLIHPHPAARPWREDKQSHVQPEAGPIHPLDPKQAEAVFMSTVTMLGLQ